MVVWKQTIDQIEMNFFVSFGFLCVAVMVYSFLLALVYYRQRRHQETLEAFFKF